MAMNVIVNEILAAGKKLGMSQADIAQRAGLHPVSVSRISASGNARYETIALLARTVGLKITLVPDNSVAESLIKGNLF